MDNIEQYTQHLITMAIDYAPRILLAGLTLIAGIMLIKPLIRRMKSVLQKREVDPSLIPFLASLTNALLYAMLIIAVASMIGIQTTSFITILGAAGLAIGLALQGSLANFAGGVLILFFKPFKVGETIESNGIIATVTEIQVFHTILKSYDNKIIILPNGTLSNNMIINYSRMETRLVEWVFGISYDNNIEKARQIILNEIFTDERVLNKQEPFINVSSLGDSAVNLKVRAEVKQDDYWPIFFAMNERIKIRFDQQEIQIPYPQRDVHVVHKN